MSENPPFQTLQGVLDYQEELVGESARAAAILAASNFKVWLGEVIKARLGAGAMSNDLRKQLFGNRGLFYTFAAKIDIACAHRSL